MGKKEKGGFKLPEGYFDRFPDRLQDRLRQGSGMPDNSMDAAEASGHGRAGNPEKGTPQAGFRTPEGYFESFGERLQQRLKDAEPLKDTSESRATGRRVIPLKSKYLAWTAAVAAAVLLAVVFWPASQGKNLDFGDLADAEIEQYLDIGYEDISAYELAESLPLERLDMGQVMDTGTQEQQLLEYLDNDPEVLEEIYLEEENE